MYCAITIESFKELHCRPTRHLLSLLPWPHRCLLDSDEVHLECGRLVVDTGDEIYGPSIFSEESSLFDVVPRNFWLRVVVETPFEDVCVEGNN